MCLFSLVRLNTVLRAVSHEICCCFSSLGSGFSFAFYFSCKFLAGFVHPTGWTTALNSLEKLFLWFSCPVKPFIQSLSIAICGFSEAVDRFLLWIWLWKKLLLPALLDSLFALPAELLTRVFCDLFKAKWAELGDISHLQWILSGAGWGLLTQETPGRGDAVCLKVNKEEAQTCSASTAVCRTHLSAPRVQCVLWNCSAKLVSCCCLLILLSAVWIPAGPAGSWNRKSLVEGGASRQLRQRGECSALLSLLDRFCLLGLTLLHEH